VWQVFEYYGVRPDLYVLTFALVGVALLAVYWMAGWKEGLSDKLGGTMTQTMFGTGNALVLLSSVAAALMGMARLPVLAARQLEPHELGAVPRVEIPWDFTALCSALAVLALIAVILVRHPVWRPLHVISAIGMTALALVTIAIASDLSPLQKVEVVCVAVGLLLLIVSHVGWWREADRESELVTLGMLFGALLVGVPLAIATIVDRSAEKHGAPTGWLINELSWLAAAVLLFATGFLFRLRVTTIIGAILLTVYLFTLVLLVPWARAQERVGVVAVVLAVSGGAIFVLGLVLSVFREALLKMPERVRNREGVFKVLTWR
jgi:hypothetical protein